MSYMDQNYRALAVEVVVLMAVRVCAPATGVDWDDEREMGTAA